MKESLRWSDNVLFDWQILIPSSQTGQLFKVDFTWNYTIQLKPYHSLCCYWNSRDVIVLMIGKIHSQNKQMKWTNKTKTLSRKG